MKKSIFTLLILLFTVNHFLYSQIIIGNNDNVTTVFTPPGAHRVAVRDSCTQNMIVSKIYVRIGVSGSGFIKCAIYSDSSARPGKFLMGTNELTNPGTGWQSFDLTENLALTAGTFYHIAYWTNNTGYRIYYSEIAEGLGVGYTQVTPYGAWPNSFVATGWGTGEEIDCIYAEGTAGPNRIEQQKDSPNLFAFYPNPVKDKLTITLNNRASQASIKMYDLKGMKLYEGIAAGTTTIDMSPYAPGIYIMHIEIGSELKVAKIIK